MGHGARWRAHANATLTRSNVGHGTRHTSGAAEKTAISSGAMYATVPTPIVTSRSTLLLSSKSHTLALRCVHRYEYFGWYSRWCVCACVRACVCACVFVAIVGACVASQCECAQSACRGAHLSVTLFSLDSKVLPSPPHTGAHLCIQQDVLGLEVAVHHRRSPRVQVTHGRCHLTRRHGSDTTPQRHTPYRTTICYATTTPTRRS